MPQPYLHLFQFVVCCTIFYVNPSHAAYNIDYLYDQCVPDPSLRVLVLGQGEVSTYGIVRLTESNDYVTNTNCAMRIVAPAGYSLFIKIDWIDIHSTTTTCNNNIDYLRVTSVNSFPDFDIYYCGQEIPAYSSLAASSGVVDIRFISGPDVSNRDGGFELHYNIYRTGVTCSSGEWNCTDSGWCILDELVCDNRENCFDGADEWHCSFLTSEFLPIIIMALIIGGVLIGFLVLICYDSKKKRKTKSRVQNTPQDQSRSNPPPARPAAAAAASSSSASPPAQPPYSEPLPTYTFSSDYANRYMQGGAIATVAVTSEDDTDLGSSSELPPPAALYPPMTASRSFPPPYTQLTSVE